MTSISISPNITIKLVIRSVVAISAGKVLFKSP